MENRINHMEYLPDMEQINPEIKNKVIAAYNSYNADKYTEKDVINALKADILTPDDFGALLSPVALPFLEQMAKRAREKKRQFFGDNVYIFTPIFSNQAIFF